MPMPQSLSGVVSRTNHSGFALAERPEQWLTISKYADPPPTMPQVGQRVTVQVDSKGFVRGIGEDAAPAAPAAPAGRDETAVRLAVLHAAATFAASRPEAKSEDVPRLAERWLAWVLER